MHRAIFIAVLCISVAIVASAQDEPTRKPKSLSGYAKETWQDLLHRSKKWWPWGKDRSNPSPSLEADDATENLDPDSGVEDTPPESPAEFSSVEERDYSEGVDASKEKPNPQPYRRPTEFSPPNLTDEQGRPVTKPAPKPERVPEKVSTSRTRPKLTPSKQTKPIPNYGPQPAVIFQQIRERGEKWWREGTPYSQRQSKDGYRMDCSGFVSYVRQAFKIPRPPQWSNPGASRCGD